MSLILIALYKTANLVNLNFYSGSIKFILVVQKLSKDFIRVLLISTIGKMHKFYSIKIANSFERKCHVANFSTVFFVFVTLYFRQIQVKMFLTCLENELNLFKFVPLFIKCKYIQNIVLGKSRNNSCWSTEKG